MKRRSMDHDAADAPSHPEDIWGAAFAVSFLVFLRHLAPDVSLLDSGELVTAAFHFGVAHPPGYPLWVLSGYLWCHVIVPFGNPAWRIGSMSAFTGGLLVGLMAFMMIRTTRLLLQTVPAIHAAHAPLRRWLATTVGVGTALLFRSRQRSTERLYRLPGAILLSCFASQVSLQIGKACSLNPRSLSDLVPEWV